MEMMIATDAFAALAQPTRLAVVRLLVTAGANGMTSGDIGETLGVRANTMSTNLIILARARLIRSEREGRSVRYFADFEGLRDLLSFLMEDCCGGRPELCKPALDAIACNC